jgi:hypothetical protein
MARHDSSALVGKRIKLTMMIDPDPVPVGSEGEVVWVNRVPSLGFTQMAIKWDNGRTLMLSIPPDTYEVIS